MDNKLKKILLIFLVIGVLLVVYGIYTANNTENLDKIQSVRLSTLGTSNIEIDKSIRDSFIEDTLIGYLSEIEEFDANKDLDSQYYDLINAVLNINYTFDKNIQKVSNNTELPVLEVGTIDYFVTNENLYKNMNTLYNLNIKEIDFMSMNIYNYNNLVDFTYQDIDEKKLYFTSAQYDKEVGNYCVGIRDIQFVDGKYKINANIYKYYFTESNKMRSIGNKLKLYIKSGNYDYIDKNMVGSSEVQKVEKVFYLTDNQDEIFKYKVHKIETLNSTSEKREVEKIEEIENLEEGLKVEDDGIDGDVIE